MEQTIFYIIIVVVIFDFVIDRTLDYLNSKNLSITIPPQAEGIYDPEKYKKSQEYFRANNNFAQVTSTFSFILILTVLFLDGFAYVDSLARVYSSSPILIALIFFGIIGIISDILSTPFSLYKTFVIEEKFGFNRTTLKTFFADKFKGYVLGILIGAPILALIVWFYLNTGKLFWIYMWVAMSLFMILATMFYASVIVPMFNKLTPLPEGELRSAIENYCKQVGFKLDNLFIMNGSKRSTKANAFFSGLGAKKKIVLFDTLIEKHTTDELVAVLAHEIGHYKKKHTLSALILSVVQTGFMLFILSLFIDNPSLSKALGVTEPSFHIGLIAFGMLYSPLSLILGIIMNVLSRKNEFEADEYAAKTFESKSLQNALKKLSSDSLSNLTPHPAYVFVHYSHPPLLTRLSALDRF